MRLQLSLAALSLFLFLLLVCQTIANLNVDRQALLGFAAVVPHGRKLNWSSKSSICTSWVGVSCDPNNTRVIALRLPAVGFNGPIPPNTFQKLDALAVLSLRSNSLSGSLPSDILSLPSLRYVYLQENNFSGDIPSLISSEINFLDLSMNSFNGNIPSSLQNLTDLIGLNLQNNALSGSIPNLNLPRLKVFNVSYNNLNGSIPPSLQRFSASSFEGNSLLCGLPMKRCFVSPSPSPSPTPSPVFLPPTPSPSPANQPTLFPTSSPPPSLISTPTIPPSSVVPQKPKAKKMLSTGAIIGIGVGACSALFLAMIVVFCCLKKKGTSGGASGRQAYSGEKPKEGYGSGVQEAEKNKLVFFDRYAYNFDLEDLLRASAEVMGKGSYGTTYKAILEEGTAVVVKRLKEVVVSKREFDQQMDIIGTVGRNPNLVPLRAYYFSKDEKLLVYDYMVFGSLSLQLHANRENGRTLDWESRVKVCLGAARGIAHIHSNGGKFYHGNIKSSNILLTQDLRGCVSDFGLTPLMGSPTPHSRSTGYRAPEAIETRKCTQKSDVYSFGVLLLEVLTGKSPVPAPGNGEVLDLPRWVQSVVREEWTAEVFDLELTKNRNIEEEMVQMLQVAMACVEKVPDVRPNMNEVVRMMEDVWSPESGKRLSEEEDVNSRSPVTPTP